MCRIRSFAGLAPCGAPRGQPHPWPKLRGANILEYNWTGRLDLSGNWTANNSFSDRRAGISSQGGSVINNGGTVTITTGDNVTDATGNKSIYIGGGNTIGVSVAGEWVCPPERWPPRAPPPLRGHCKNSLALAIPIIRAAPCTRASTPKPVAPTLRIIRIPSQTFEPHEFCRATGWL